MVSVHPAQWCTSPLGVVPAGLGTALAHCHDSVYFPGVSFWWNKFYSFFKSVVVGFLRMLDMLVAKWVPTPCYNDAYSVGTPKWAFWGKGWQTYHKTTFSPRIGRFFLVSKRTFYFLVFFLLDAPYREGQASWAWPS